MQFKDKLKPLLDIFSTARKKFLLLFTGLFLSNIAVAIFEGLTFIFVFTAFSTLTTDSTNSDKIHRILLSLAPQLAALFQTRFLHFIFFLLLAISMQICKSLCIFCSNMHYTRILNRFQVGLIKIFREQLFSFKFSFISNYKAGELGNSSKIPFEAFPICLLGLNSMAQCSLTILVLLAILLRISVSFTVMICGLVSLMAFIQKALLRRIKKLSMICSEDKNEYVKSFYQMISGIRIITIFHRFSYMIEQIDEIASRVTATTYRLARSAQLLRPINEVFVLFIVAFCAFVGYSLMKDKGDVGISFLVTYLIILMRLSNQIPAFISSLGEVAHHWGDVDRLLTLLSKEGKEYASDGHVQLPPFQSAIEFRQVSHSYQKDLPVLHSVSFTVPKGKNIAFVGKSGAGKSTLVDLLLHLYGPTQGAIFIDQIPLDEISLKSWRDQVGVVSQDVFIFNETIFNNICFGLKDVSPEEVRNAAYIAGCGEFIEKLPDQYETVLGERGYRLSGGEKQRISLARALLKNPEVLILDEATSALDTHTERFILDTLEKFYGKKTLLVIAHRLSTIMHCDQILVLDQGRIIERGTHEELLDARGSYARMWASQQTKEQQLATVS